MSSVIASCCCPRRSSPTFSDCHRVLPIIDIIGGVVLLIIGTLIASGMISASIGTMCGVFAGGAFLLAAGLSTLGQRHCQCLAC